MGGKGVRKSSLDDFKVGDLVFWTSQAGGYAARKTGTVLLLLPKGAPLDRRCDHKRIRVANYLCRYDSSRSTRDRMLVSVPRTGKTGKELKPALYAPIVSGIRKCKRKV